jgi:hypothetical protein
MKNKILSLAVLIFINISYVGYLGAGPCPGKCTPNYTPDANGYCGLVTVSCSDSPTGEVVRMGCTKVKGTYPHEGDPIP